MAAARGIAQQLSASGDMTAVDEFGPIVGLLMALCVDLSTRATDSAPREQHTQGAVARNCDDCIDGISVVTAHIVL